MLLTTSHYLPRNGLLPLISAQYQFKHPCTTLLNAADHLFPLLWFSSVSFAEGNRQMVVKSSAKAVNPLEMTQSFVTGLRSDLYKVPTVIPSYCCTNKLTVKQRRLMNMQYVNTCIFLIALLYVKYYSSDIMHWKMKEIWTTRIKMEVGRGCKMCL